MEFSVRELSVRHNIQQTLLIQQIPTQWAFVLLTVFDILSPKPVAPIVTYTKWTRYNLCTHKRWWTEHCHFHVTTTNQGKLKRPLSLLATNSLLLFTLDVLSSCWMVLLCNKGHAVDWVGWFMSLVGKSYANNMLMAPSQLPKDRKQNQTKEKQQQEQVSTQSMVTSPQGNIHENYVKCSLKKSCKDIFMKLYYILSDLLFFWCKLASQLRKYGWNLFSNTLPGDQS